MAVIVFFLCLSPYDTFINYATLMVNVNASLRLVSYKNVIIITTYMEDHCVYNEYSFVFFNLKTLYALFHVSFS